MTKPRLYAETLFIRVPAGTRAQIEAVRGDALQSDWLRRAVKTAIDKPVKLSAPRILGPAPGRRTVSNKTIREAVRAAIRERPIGTKKGKRG